MNARYYIPTLNRFLSADPIIPNPTNPQSWNRYSYTFNNPLNYIDPSGHDPAWCADIYESQGDSSCNHSANIDPVIEYYDPVNASDTQLFFALKDIAVVEIYQMFYEDRLPVEFIEHYAYGHGYPIYLSVSEMAQLGVDIDLRQHSTFMELVDELSSDGGGTKSVTFRLTGEDQLIASTHGTLGRFTGNFQGELTVAESGEWSFEGRVNFYDAYEFDKRDWGERSIPAEILTRAGRLLPGQGFEIFSPNVPISQTHLQNEAIWIGAGIQGPQSRLIIELNQ